MNHLQGMILQIGDVLVRFMSGVALPDNAGEIPKSAGYKLSL